MLSLASDAFIIFGSIKEGITGQHKWHNAQKERALEWNNCFDHNVQEKTARGRLNTHLFVHSARVLCTFSTRCSSIDNNSSSLHFYSIGIFVALSRVPVYSSLCCCIRYLEYSLAHSTSTVEYTLTSNNKTAGKSSMGNSVVLRLPMRDCNETANECQWVHGRIGHYTATNWNIRVANLSAHCWLLPQCKISLPTKRIFREK